MSYMYVSSLATISTIISTQAINTSNTQVQTKCKLVCNELVCKQNGMHN